MGIVFNQSYKNIIIISIAILIGAINTLYFYPVFLKEEYYGLVVFLLATSNLLMPLVAFGSQHTIIKYYSSYSNKNERRSEEHTSELQSPCNLVCRLLLEKKKSRMPSSA